MFSLAKRGASALSPEMHLRLSSGGWGAYVGCVLCSTNSWVSRTNFYLIGEKEAKKISARAGGESLLPRGACHRQGVSIYTLQKRQGEVLEKHLGSTRGGVGEQPRFQLSRGV